MLFPHELVYSSTVLGGVLPPPTPWLGEPPIDAAVAAGEVLALWRDRPDWTGPGGGLRIAIVCDVSEPRTPGPHTPEPATPEPRTPPIPGSAGSAVTGEAGDHEPGVRRGARIPEFAAAASWLLVVAAHRSLLEAGHGAGHGGRAVRGGGQVHSVVVCAGERPPAIPPGRARPPVSRFVSAAQTMTLARGIAAAARSVGLTGGPPAARLLVLITDARHSPERLDRARAQVDRLQARGCGVVWLCPTPGVDPRADGRLLGRARDGAPTFPGASTLYLDPTRTPPGPTIAVTAVNALHRADPLHQTRTPSAGTAAGGDRR